MTINITEIDENFLKNFLKDFYHKIIYTDDFNTFEDTTIKWIKNVIEKHNKNPEIFLKMMQNHKKHQIWFASIVGFFYQHGIGCDINRKMTLELYLLIVNNNESLSNNSNKLYLTKENGNDINELQGINVVIGSYLLSLFYYRDIILARENLLKEKPIDIKKSAIADNAEAQNKLGYCYLKGKGVVKDEKKAFEWFLKSANNGFTSGQYSLGYCYENGIGTKKNIEVAIKWYEIGLGLRSIEKVN